MMSHQFYDQAAKCFRAAGDLILESKAIAYLKASTASDRLLQADAMQKNNRKTKLTRKAIRDHEKAATELFVSAGDEFLKLSTMSE